MMFLTDNWLAPERFSLSSGREIAIQKFHLSFRKVGADPGFGNKPIVEFGGEFLYPELAVVRLMEGRGFDAVWIDAYRGKFWDGMSSERELPDCASAVYQRILRARGGHRGGFWDVLAWKGSEFNFIELKQNSADCKDRISEKQARWLETAMGIGIDPSCFFVCEWNYESE